MACKLCNKSLYFETSWRHTDAGYGDTDYGGVNIHNVGVRICPNCGEVKLPDKLKNASIEEQEEFVMNILSKVIANNLKYFSEENNIEDEMYEKINKVINLANDNYIDKFLKLNNLRFEKGILRCNCGEIISKGIDLNDALINLSLNDTNFCRVCGRNVKKISYNIKEEDLKAVEYIIESRKTWDNAE